MPPKKVFSIELVLLGRQKGGDYLQGTTIMSLENSQGRRRAAFDKRICL